MNEPRSRLPSLLGRSLPERWSTDPFTMLRKEMDRLFDDAFRGFGPPAATGAAAGAMGFTAPSIDVSETQGELRVSVELPGVDQKDIDVTLDGDLLTIRGEKRTESRDESESRHVMERSYGAFARSIRLPFQADPDRISAQCENGVLTVTVPKPAEAQQRTRRIAVNAGNAPGITQGSEADRKLGDAAQAMRSLDNQPTTEEAGVTERSQADQAR